MNGAGKTGTKVKFHECQTVPATSAKSGPLTFPERSKVGLNEKKGKKGSQRLYVSIAVRLRLGLANVCSLAHNPPQLNSHTLLGTLEGAMCICFGGSGKPQASLWLRHSVSSVSSFSLHDYPTTAKGERVWGDGAA